MDNTLNTLFIHNILLKGLYSRFSLQRYEDSHTWTIPQSWDIEHRILQNKRKMRFLVNFVLNKLRNSNISITFASIMRIDIITVLPEMLEGFVGESILARAQKKGLAEIHLHNLRDYTLDKWRRVDDYPYGGSAGMVMQCEPIDRCISALKAEREYDDVIYVSPDGETFNQKIANEMSLQGNLIILCGHYKGIDQRVRDHLITREISIGDYVLTGGELAAAIIADAVIRLVPGVISDEQSALSDCFQDDILAAPIYTRPANYNGWEVPEILLSGNEAKIRQWEFDQAMERTKRLRPDLLE